MKHYDTRVDAYIAKSAPFAKEILDHVRELVHQACPDAAETIKWGFPHFEYEGILCSMASFKQHCSFGFWKGSIMKDPHGVMKTVCKTAMGSFGRISSLNDLPSDKILIQYIKEAARLNEEYVKLPRIGMKKKSKPVALPADFLKALKKNNQAMKAFDAFSNSHRKEYLEWIEEAKTEETRNKRTAAAVELISEGKSKDWKYVK